MRKRLFLFSIFCFLFSSLSFAQETCKLRGEIRDSIGLPVFDASVSAFNSKNEGVAFTFTDTEGAFVLELPCGESYDVEAEHMDFDSYSENIQMDRSKSVTFRMSRAAISLQEAVIRAKQPITVKGDTIEYDADSFRTAADENLEDLLKKLPGLQVENGKVYYEGKEIKTIKVGDREVLGGNTKLLTKNLPADAIDKIQLNKKFKANPFANSLSDDEEAMLNIELKEDKKSLVFGNATLGGDAHEHTDIQTKLFYFSPKTDGTFITDYNTFGKEVFTYEDYFAFLGGMSELMEEGSSFSLREEQNRISLGTAQDAADMNAFLSALHFGYEPSKKLYTNGFVLFNNNNLKFKSTQERIGAGMNYKDEQMNDQHLLSTLGRVRLDFTPDSKSQIKYRVNFNYLENEDEQFADTHLNEISTGSRDNLTDKTSFSLRQNLSYIRKIGRDHNLGIYVRHQLSNDQPDLYINSEMIPLMIDSVNFFNLRQNKELNTQNLQVYGIYNHLLTNTSNLRLKAGSNFSWQNLENKIYENNSIVNREFFQSDSDFNFTELYADLTYTKKLGVLKVDVGAGVHNFQEKTTLIDGSKQDLNFTKILPHLNAEVNLNNTHNFNLSYLQEYKLPNLTELSNGYDVQNYFSVFKGFLGLRESLYHTATLRYGYFNSFSFLNFYAGATYNRSIDNVQNSSNLGAFPQINSMINNPEDDQTLSIYLGGGKRFSRFYSLNLNGNISYLDYFTRINLYDPDNNLISNLVNNSTLTQNYTLTNKFKIKKKVEFDLGLNYMHNDFKSLTDNEFTTWRPFGKFAWSISDKFLFQSDYSYRIQYQNEDLINENQSLNASLRYHIAKSTYLTLMGGNLLGNETLVNSSFDAVNNQTIINTKEVLGRYFIVQLRYKF
ncbi:MAG TPA: carboxypeptidase regulatory-like domain-containing protein [Moheibacter sp.]|nr:carboxypeptidase regulatory-like domain-containing protein [Moheibacter sp.]